MKLTKLWQFGLLGIFGLLLIIGNPGSVQADEKDFYVVTAEPKWEAKKGEAPVVGRAGAKVTKIERYAFIPGFIVVNKDDVVNLHIHDVKGSKHIVEVPACGVKGELINRGEEKTISFVADKTGTFKVTCSNHKDLTKEGPMEMYIYVVDPK
jgi:plastocyanin